MSFFIVWRQNPDRTYAEDVYDPEIAFFNWTDRDYITLQEAREVYHKLGKILEEINWQKEYVS